MHFLKLIKFVEDNKDKLDWYWDNISQYQSLSEDFIREFQDKVEWNQPFYFQKLL